MKIVLYLRDLVEAQPLLLFGLLAILGFYFGRMARGLRLPSLIGFMLLGVVLGPSALHILRHEHLAELDFMTEMALGFVAFSIGAELNLGEIRKLGTGIVWIILAESFGAFLVVTLGVYYVTGSWPTAILFGAVAPASAPAGTVAVIQEYRARGSLTRALYAVVGFDDGLAIIIFGFAAALSKSLLLKTIGVPGHSGGILPAMSKPLEELLLSLLIGTLLGMIFCWLTRRLEAPRDMLIITFGTILIATGLATRYHFSLILTNMMIGMVLVNTQPPNFVRRVTAPLLDLMPLMFLLFFSLAGAHLDLRELPRLGLVGAVYIVSRSGGLLGGAWLGAVIGRMEDKIRRYLGLGILSQAGVAVALSLIIHHDMSLLAKKPAVAAACRAFATAHPGVPRLDYDPIYMATALITTITATCIVFEIIGPILTRIALIRSGEADPEIVRAEQRRGKVELSEEIRPPQ